MVPCRVRFTVTAILDTVSDATWGTSREGPWVLVDASGSVCAGRARSRRHAVSGPRRSMNATTSSTPCRVLRLVITHGRRCASGRVRAVSAAITTRLAPTWGARSILLVTRSHLGDAGAAFAGDFLAGSDVDHADRQVGQLGAEGGGQVVAATLDEHDVGVGELAQHAVDGLQVDGAVLPDGGVWAAASFYTQDAFGRQRAAGGEQALVLLGADVVDDGDEVPAVAHGLAQHLQQRSFAGADRPADADAQRGQPFGAARDAVQGGSGGYEGAFMSGRGANTGFRGDWTARPARGCRPAGPAGRRRGCGGRRRRRRQVSAGRAGAGCAGRRPGPGERL